MSIRAEAARDRDSIRSVNTAAFGTPAEADLVDALRRHVQPIISLVAECDGQITGHILFSPVTLSGNPDLDIMGLGPMAVLPACQRQGIGSALVHAGLDECRQREKDAVVVLGHPDYYPRFGFSPASRFGISCEFDAPDEAFMLLELRRGVLHGKTGTARYHAAFAAV
ncbi:MAG: N-acetyltransferase [Woeseiaceae bacterium]|nr:N-acetyltransferase [Woeseiaceae bacterium]